MNKRGKTFIISGPSGVGKSTVLKAVMEHMPNLRFSVSATTRAMRPGEQEGVNYYYVSRDEFEKMIADHELVEYNLYNNNYYGTPMGPIERTLEQGVDIILDVDPHGALNVRGRWPDAILIFITPPSLSELKRRLESRGDTSPKDIEERLRQASWECRQSFQYDYIVVNDKLVPCIQEVEAILQAENYRTSRRSDFMNHLLKEEI